MIAFLTDTTWWSPAGVVAWKPPQLPAQSVVDAPACVVHEKEYSQLLASLSKVVKLAKME